MPDVAYNAGPLVNRRVAGVGFSASTRLMEAFESSEEACLAGRATGGALDRHTASMTEAVRGRVRPEPPSMCSDTLYSGMNAGS
jgi:hypothetical protein